MQTGIIVIAEFGEIRYEEEAPVKEPVRSALENDPRKNLANMRLAQLLSVCWLCFFTFQLNAGTLRLGSQHAPGATQAGASGDSVGPMLSGDGRYVLFASEAEDVISNSIPSGKAF